MTAYLLSVCCTVAALADASARAQPSGPPESAPAATPAPAQPTLRYQLSNGLKVILSPDHVGHRVTVSMRYAVGTSDDPEGYAGLAHLVQRLTFRGSRHLRPSEAYSGLELAGATSIDAFTGATATVFGCALPESQLETALWIESERMAFTLEKLNAQSLELERRIVEIQERGKRNDPLLHWSLEALLPKGHPYRERPTSLDDVEAIGLRDVQWFFQQWYRPDNATLRLVGEFDATRALALIQRYFDPVVAPAIPLPVRPKPSVALTAVRRVQIAARNFAPTLRVMWVVPEGDPSLEVALLVLRRRLRVELSRFALAGTTARFFRLLVGVEALFGVDTSFTDSVRAPAIDDAVRVAVQRLQKETISDAELRAARADLRDATVHDAQLVSYALDASAGEFSDRLSRVDAQSVAAAARQYLRLDRRMIAQLEPFSNAPSNGVILSVVDAAQ